MLYGADIENLRVGRNGGDAINDRVVSGHDGRLGRIELDQTHAAVGVCQRLNDRRRVRGKRVLMPICATETKECDVRGYVQTSTELVIGIVISTLYSNWFSNH